MTKRGAWGSRVGFVLAVVGSAVGLANIWRLPYVIGESGGAAFLLIYLLCLFAVGFPVFLSEILIGVSTKSGPKRAMEIRGKKKFWGRCGEMTVFTGLIVSAFYSVVAGWILGYFLFALRGDLSSQSDPEQVAAVFSQLTSHPFFPSLLHFLFLAMCSVILCGGVQKGIERWNTVMMPALFLILLVLLLKGLSLPNAWSGIQYLLSPDWEELTPRAWMAALGQAFFTLSIGQGTMVTYGSYLSSGEGIVKSGVAVVFMDTLVSILAAFAIFTIVFSVGLLPDAGPSLLFNTLPIIFSKIPGGYVASVFFFLLVLFAATTSQISAMEPSIAYLVDQKGWKRPRAICAVFFAAFALGTPCALSYSLFDSFLLFEMPILDFVSTFTSVVLIPLGGLCAVVIVGWVWGADRAIAYLSKGLSRPIESRFFLRRYFSICLKYLAPILIVAIFLHSIQVL